MRQDDLPCKHERAPVDQAIHNVSRRFRRSCSVRSARRVKMIFMPRKAPMELEHAPFSCTTGRGRKALNVTASLKCGEIRFLRRMQRAKILDPKPLNAVHSTLNRGVLSGRQ